MTPIALLLKSLASGELPEVEFPPYPSAPQLANWQLLYDRQIPKGSTTTITYAASTWRDYQRPLEPLVSVALTKNPSTVTWIFWSAPTWKMYGYGGLSAATIGATVAATLTAMNAYGSSEALVNYTVVDVTLYNNRPVLTYGVTRVVSNSPETPSFVGDPVVSVTASKLVTQWEIVSGNPIVGNLRGFDIDSNGNIYVANPALFINDPYVLNSQYVLTVRCTDTNGIYGFVEIPVAVANSRSELSTFRYINFTANDVSFNTSYGSYCWRQYDLGLFLELNCAGDRLPVTATATSYQPGGEQSGGEPEKAFDALDSSSWLSYAWLNGPSSITADLGAAVAVRSIRFLPSVAEQLYPKSVVISVSSNGVDWTPLMTPSFTVSDTYPKILNIQ